MEVEKEQLEAAKRLGAIKLAKRSKIPGFRPGKAPFHVIQRQLGEGPILEEAVDIVANDIYQKALDEAEIDPYGQGSLQNIPSTDPLILEFVIPLAATVKLGNYLSIRKSYTIPSVTEEEINTVVENIRDQHAILEPATRAVIENDAVDIKITGVRNDDGSFLVKEKETQVIIHGDTNQIEYEWPFPGFSRTLIGMGIGEERTITHKFDDTSPYESLRGVEATFTLSVKEVKNRTLPEVNDEFAVTVGEYPNLENLMMEIKKSLAERKLQSYNDEYDAAVLQEIIDQSSVQYPPQMLEKEIDEEIHNFQHRLESQRLDMDLYLKSRGIDLVALREEVKPTAIQNLTRSLILFEIGKLEKIRVDPKRLEQETIQTMNSLAQSLPEKEAKKLGNKNVMNNLMSNVMVDLLTRQTIERIRQITSGQSDEGDNSEDSSAQESTVSEVVEENLPNPDSV